MIVLNNLDHPKAFKTDTELQIKKVKFKLSKRSFLISSFHCQAIHNLKSIFFVVGDHHHCSFAALLLLGVSLCFLFFLSSSFIHFVCSHSSQGETRQNQILFITMMNNPKSLNKSFQFLKLCCVCLLFDDHFFSFFFFFFFFTSLCHSLLTLSF